MATGFGGMMNISGGGMSPYMMMEAMRGGGLGPDQAQTPDIAGSVIRGMMLAKESREQNQEDQMKKNQQMLQSLELEQAQRKETYDEGMDALTSNDTDKWNTFQQKNPGIAHLAQSDYQAQQIKLGALKAEGLKTSLQGMTWQTYQDPKTQDAIGQYMPNGKAPTFANQQEFEDWQMQTSGTLDKLTGNLGDLYRLQMQYRNTKDPQIKAILDQQQAKTQLEYEKDLASIQRQEQEINKNKKASFSFNDSFMGAKGFVDNDKDLAKLGPDPTDPTTNKVTGVGPKTFATTQIANIARDLYSQHQDFGTNDSLQYATKLYKYRSDPNLQRDIVSLRAHYKTKGVEEQFEKAWGLPANIFLSGSSGGQ